MQYESTSLLIRQQLMMKQLVESEDHSKECDEELEYQKRLAKMSATMVKIAVREDNSHRNGCKDVGHDRTNNDIMRL